MTMPKGGGNLKRRMTALACLQPDMTTAEVAVVLECSLSAVRRYNTTLALGFVRRPRGRPRKDRVNVE